MELQYVYLGLRYSSWMLNTGYTLGAFASICLITMTRPSSKSNANEPFGQLGPHQHRGLFARRL